MSSNPVESLINTLAFKGITRGGVVAMEKLLQQGYAVALEAGSPAHSYFLKRLTEIAQADGVIDAWLIAISMTMFAQGIAIGRGDTEIDEYHVEEAEAGLCHHYPTCQKMRLMNFVEALEMIINPEATAGGT
jgi:hypothetical protein